MNFFSMNDVINPILAGSLILLIFLAMANPNKVNVKANRWFTAFIISIFFVVFDEIYLTVLKDQIAGISYLFLNSASTHIAPIFYLSISYFTNPNKKWKFKNCLHFLFGIIAFIIIITVEKNNNYNLSYVNAVYKIFYALLSLQILIYGYLTFIQLSNHQKNVELFSSSTEAVDLKWLSNIVKIVVVLLMIWVIDMQFEISTKDFLILNLLVLIVTFFISYHFIKQKEIYPFAENQTNQIIHIINDTNSIDEKKQLIDESKLQELKIELLHLMDNKKLFLDPNISLIKLASEMNCTPNILSYIINNGYNENFNQFINRFRVEEAKKMILNPQMNYLSLLGIGFEVGFNSKSAFNATFKKTTGQTPSEFKKYNL